MDDSTHIEDDRLEELVGHFLRVIAEVGLLLAITGSVALGAGLALQSKIPLGDVHGRIDHLALDSNRQRLFVAELGNDSVGVVDLKQSKVVRTLTGFREPQGLGYLPTTDTLYVASGGDGSVRLLRGENLSPAGQIALGDDADNVRVDDDAHRVFVGYGKGAIAVIDAQANIKVTDIPLLGHPEGFRLAANRIFVNVPDAKQIAVADRSTNKVVATWSTADLRSNYPLALDESGNVLAIFRSPAKIVAFGKQDGQLLSEADTCGDSDDLFVDAKRHRVYVSCGDGHLDVFSKPNDQIQRVAQIQTVMGARTSLFVSENDRLYLAVRASGSTPAAVWVFRPVD